MMLTGCATTANYEKILQTWVGDSESHLVQSWGPPSSTYMLGENKKVLTYFKSNGSETAYYGSLGIAETTNYTCKTDFYIDGLAMITNWRHEGNSCKSKAPKTREPASDKN